MKQGWIYIAEVGRLLKIGWTRNVPQREYGLGSSGPVTVPKSKVKILGVREGNKIDEAKLHQRFSKHLVHGREWFKKTDEIIAFAKTLSTPKKTMIASDRLISAVLYVSIPKRLLADIDRLIEKEEKIAEKGDPYGEKVTRSAVVRRLLIRGLIEAGIVKGAAA